MNQRGKTPRKSKGFAPILILLAAVVIGGVIVGAYYFGKSGWSLSLNRPSDCIGCDKIGSATPTPTSNSEEKLTYKYETFTFSYPKTWTVLDYGTSTTTDSFFQENKLNGLSDHSVILQKGAYMLFIGIDNTSKGEAGGIFLNNEELEAKKSVSDSITIQGSTYFLLKNHNQMADWLDPRREYGIYIASTLAEFIPQKVTNNDIGTVDGYDDYIRNKNGRSYLFAKFASDNIQNYTTPAEVQQEIKQMLESITW